MTFSKYLTHKTKINNLNAEKVLLQHKNHTIMHAYVKYYAHAYVNLISYLFLY